VLHTSIWGIEAFSGVLSGDGTEFWALVTTCPLPNWGVWSAADTALKRCHCDQTKRNVMGELTPQTKPLLTNSAL